MVSDEISQTDDNGDCIDLPAKFIDEMALFVEVHKFSLFSMKDQQFSIVIRINNTKYYSLRLNFLNTVSVKLEEPNRASFNEKSLFAFYIDSRQFITPVNAITLNKSQVGNYLISYEENYYNSDVLTITNLTTNNPPNPAKSTPDNYFLNLEGVFMPYIPYFSNCRQFGNMGFFYEITENVYNCNLVDPDSVKVINPFKFGDKPFSDTCDSVQYDCVLDEYLNFQFVTDTWLQQQLQTPLFKITSTPIVYNENDINNGGYSTDELVDIQVASEIPSGKLPKKITLSIGYYQTEKKIINGQIGFESFIKPTDKEADGTTPYTYTLEVSFHSMNQSELTIAFALDIQVYLVMYFIIGSVSLISICIFTGYHALFRSALYGTYLTVIPTGIILILNLLIMGGKMWDYPFNFYGCDPKAGDCQLSIFDTIRDDGISLSDDAMKSLRNGRYAVSIIVIGIYIMNFCANLLIPESKNKVDKMLGQVSFDGNVWFKKFWEKSYFMFFYLVMIIIMEVIINWSLSNNFGDNVWYYLCTLKILGMLSEIMGSKFFTRKHLTAPISTGLDCVLDVATLGANDFFDFLLSFYIEQGIQMIERTYFNVIMGEIQDFVEDTYKQAKAILVAAWEKNQNEDQEEDNPDYLSTGLRKQNDEISLSNSNIVLSDHYEESFESNIFFDELAENDINQKDKELKSKIENTSKLRNEKGRPRLGKELIQKLKKLDTSFDEMRDYDPTEVSYKSLLNFQIERKQLERKQQHDLEQKAEEEKKQKEALYRQMKSLQQQKEEIDTTSGECIDRYADFVNGMIGPLVLPIIASECWIFYEQNDLANAYNIQRKSYVYYLLFTIIIIPFRIAIDIVYYHLWVVFHDVDFLVYAGKTKRRFEKRRKIWKADQTTSESDDESQSQDGQVHINDHRDKEDEDSEEEEELKDLDKWCFSSQYFFVQAFFLIGMMQCVIGIFGITSTGYNLFKDYMLLPIIALWYFLCIFVHKLCIFLGKNLGIWKVKQQDVNSQANTKEDIPKSEQDYLNEQEDDLEMRMYQMNQQKIIQTKLQQQFFDQIFKINKYLFYKQGKRYIFR